MNLAVPSIKSTCILVLGMHRSGTSALTRCLNLVGMDLGSHLLSPEKMNAKGFWEHADAVRINDELLAAFGMLWLSLDPLPDGWLASDAAAAARAEIRLLVKRDFDGVPLWGIKDPRMCRLAPLWIDVLQEMGIGVVAVLMVRSPLEVAASLHRAHGLSVPHGVLLWGLHLAESDVASRNIPRVMVDYEHLLSDAVSVVSSIGTSLQVTWPIPPADRCDAIRAFLDDGLRTHRQKALSEAAPPIINDMVHACASIIEDQVPAHWRALADLSVRMQAQLEILAYAHRDDSCAGRKGATPQASEGDWVQRAVLYYAADDEPFSEDRSVSMNLPRGRGQIDFDLPVGGSELARLRLDPIDQRGAFELHSVMLLDRLGRVLCDCNDVAAGVELVGIHETAGLAREGHTIAYTNDDPQINISCAPGLFPRSVARVRVDMECLSQGALVEELEAQNAQRAQERSSSISREEALRVANERALQIEVAQREQLRGLLEQVNDTLDSTKGELVDAKAELERQAKQSRGALESGRCEIDRLTAVQLAQARELSAIQQSTLWRVLVHLRAALSHIPPSARGQLRRGAKAAWWAVTPWRLPARLRFLRQRSAIQAMYRGGATENAAASSPAALSVITFVPEDVGAGAGHYMLTSGEKRYTYVPPRPPANLDQELAAMEKPPRFSIVVPVYNTPPNLLDKLVESVLAQWYPHWELILVNDNSSLEHIRGDLDRLVDQRIVVVHLSENKRISEATNEGIVRATGEYIVFADHDDELTADCLYELARCIGREDPDFIYSDEDKIAESGQYVEPFFKPDWSPDTMMSTMYTCHVSCVRRELVNEVGGLRQEYDGSQDWDFILRVVEKTNRIAHIPKVLYHWRIIAASVASDLSAKPYAVSAGKRAREDAMARRGHEGEMEPVEELPGYYRPVYRLRGEPRVSIIIPSKNNYQILRQCIDSIESKTTYRNVEIVVIDNGSTDPATLKYIHHLRGQQRLKVLSYNQPFNYSAINNLGASEASGELLLFLNDDTEVLVPDWLERLGGYAQLPHVGAVGAKLLYPGGQHVQHVGVVNLASGPGHAFLGADVRHGCYFARALLEHNWLAVTGACLMVERSKFDKVGCFDENLPVAYNDVDLCFRIAEAGFYNLVSPGVKLIHHESYSRGSDAVDAAKRARLRRELQMLYQKHPQFYQYDPFHNPNLGSRDVWFRWAP